MADTAVHNAVASPLQTFSKFVVSHLVYARAVSMIEHAIHATESSGQPCSALLTGESGTGKTTVCKYLVQRRPARHNVIDSDGIREVIPAFYCSLAAEVTIKGLATVMLKRLGSDRLAGDKVILTERLIDLLKTCQTEVIFLDEFHHLLRSNAVKVLDGVRDWVKGLMNETGVTVVLVGLPKCAAIIDEDPQTARRFPYRACLSHFPFSAEPSAQYIKVLKALSNAMLTHVGITLAPTLTDTDKAVAIYAATGGNMNSIRQLLFEVCDATMGAGRRRVEWNDFGEAFERSRLEHCLSPGRNPFKLSTQQLHHLIAHGGQA